jgi:hypothetical protein
MTYGENREAMLAAFDRLFDRAAGKLNFESTAEERETARKNFASRYDEALGGVVNVDLPAVNEAALARMETAIDEISPAYMATYLATAPLSMYLQETLRQIAVRAAEQRVIEHLASQADTQYGGN